MYPEKNLQNCPNWTKTIQPPDTQYVVPICCCELFIENVGQTVRYIIERINNSLAPIYLIERFSNVRLTLYRIVDFTAVRYVCLI